jgi:2-dehydropantoate 2-reductase
VGVLGPGGVGGLLAALLTRAGHEVTVLASESTATAITVGGLTVRRPNEPELLVRPVARPWLAAPVDVLLVTVKATDLLAAATRCPPACVRGAAVVPFLNGVDHPLLLRALYPAAHVVPATIRIETTRLQPGLIEQTSQFADVTVPVPDARPEPGRAAAQLLADAGLHVDTGDDETLVLWRKLAMLAPFALLTTSTRAPIGRARTERPDLVEALVAESVAAAEAVGAGMDPGPIEAFLHTAPPEMRSSMLRDAEAGRPLELDAIAGPILRALPADRAPATRAAVETIIGHELQPQVGAPASPAG